jgi:hypothetical protein
MGQAESPAIDPRKPAIGGASANRPERIPYSRRVIPIPAIGSPLSDRARLR